MVILNVLGLKDAQYDIYKTNDENIDPLKTVNDDC
jgi:hypothetical protein